MSVENNSSVNSGFSVYLDLTKPSTAGKEYLNIAVRMGKGFGEGEDETTSTSTVEKIFGFSTEDTIGEASQDISVLVSLTGPLNVSMQLNLSIGASGEYLFQLQLDNLDPSEPEIPIISLLVNLSNEELNSGTLGDTKVSNTKGTGETTGTGETNSTTGTEETTSTGETTAVTTGPNRFLAGNSFVAFLVNFTELVKQLMQMKEVQGEVEIASMHLIVSIAEDTATSIMVAAKQEEAAHIAAAVTAGISLVGSLASLGGMVKEMKSTMKSPSKESDTIYRDKVAEAKVNDPKKSIDLEQAWTDKNAASGKKLDDPSAADMQALKEKKFDQAKTNEERAELEAQYGKRDDQVDTYKSDLDKEKLDKLKADYKKEELMETARQELPASKTVYDKDGNPTEEPILYNEKGKNQTQVDSFNAMQQQKIGMWQVVSQVFHSGGQLVSEAVTAASKVPIAIQQGLQAMLQASQQLTQQQLSNSTEHFKSNTDLISQLLQALTQMRSQIAQAVQAMLNAH